MSNEINVENNENVQEEAENYFVSRSKEEQNPCDLSISAAVRYFNIEQIFNTFFPDNSLLIAKAKSKEERNKRHIEESNFVYGEIV